MPACPVHVQISGQELSLQALVDWVQADSAGAIATFSGTTRNSFEGRAVQHLEYEAYQPMAEKKLRVGPGRARAPAEFTQRSPQGCLTTQQGHGSQAISDTAAGRWQLQGVALAHRVGRVAVGETSVVIAVSSAHRRDALEVQPPLRTGRAARAYGSTEMGRSLGLRLAD